MKRKIKMSLIVLAVLVLVVSVIAVEFIVPYAVMMPPKLEVEKESKRLLNGYLPSDYNITTKQLAIHTQDSIQIAHYLALSQQDTCLETVIMLHGIGGCKEDYLGTAASLTKEGYNCFIYDARAHGKSGGQYCSYGYYEKEDLRAIVTAILEDNPTTTVGVWGSSMGAAVALQTLAIEPRIQFGIIESTFTTLRQIVYEYQKRYSQGIGLRFICNRVLDNAGKIAGFSPDDVQPIQAVTKIQQPVLIIHGDADKKISIDYGKALFDALTSKDKRFYTVKGGGHDNLFDKGGEAYYNTVQTFMKEHFTGA